MISPLLIIVSFVGSAVTEKIITEERGRVETCQITKEKNTFSLSYSTNCVQQGLNCMEQTFAFGDYSQKQLCCSMQYDSSSLLYEYCQFSLESLLAFMGLCVLSVFALQWIAIQVHRSFKYEESQLQSIKAINTDFMHFGRAQIQNQICPICLGPGSNASIVCGHIFHFECLQQFRKHNQRCPLCRINFSSVVTVYCQNCNRSKKLIQLNREEIKSFFCDDCRFFQQQHN